MQPSGWVQVGIGLCLAAVGLALSLLIPRDWAAVAGVSLLVLGLGGTVWALVAHVIEQRVQQRLGALKRTGAAGNYKDAFDVLIQESNRWEGVLRNEKCDHAAVDTWRDAVVAQIRMTPEVSNKEGVFLQPHPVEATAQQRLREYRARLDYHMMR